MMDAADKLRLERIKDWYSRFNRESFTDIPALLLEFENYLLDCEVERQRNG